MSEQDRSYGASIPAADTREPRANRDDAFLLARWYRRVLLAWFCTFMGLGAMSFLLIGGLGMFGFMLGMVLALGGRQVGLLVAKGVGAANGIPKPMLRALARCSFAKRDAVLTSGWFKFAGHLTDDTAATIAARLVSDSALPEPDTGR